MLKYLIEFIGTFIFLSVIIAVGEPIPIAIGLLAAIYFGGHISGGHFNPAVSLMMFLKNSLNINDLPFYILAQCAGAAAAYYFYINQKRVN